MGDNRYPNPPLSSSLPDPPRVLIIGGGITGAALACDLALRGFDVTLVEKDELVSAASGRHHGLLHSGGRYAVTDPLSARECMEENLILRRIAPGSFVLNGGLFVALYEEDLEYKPRFLEACREVGIPAVEIPVERALGLEPNLNPAIRAAILVPDGVMDPWRVALRFFATAQHHGARILPHTEAVDIIVQKGAVKAVAVRDHLRERNYRIEADVVVNAAGPWAARVGRMAGVQIPVRPSPGVLIAVEGRFTNRVINHLHRPGDGDIVVPQRRLSVIGTTSWTVEDPDDVDVPEDHVRLMRRRGAELIPAIANAELKAAWSAVRPLVAQGMPGTARELPRSFLCIDHKEKDGLKGFITLVGGKATTARLMAEVAGDMICRKLGLHVPCPTRKLILSPHYDFRGGSLPPRWEDSVPLDAGHFERC